MNNLSLFILQNGVNTLKNYKQIALKKEELELDFTHT